MVFPPESDDATLGSMETSALPSIPERVEKGIAWLEEQGAYDWAEKIVAAADASKFDITDCERCAVGVALGQVPRFSFATDWVRNCGFEVSARTQDRGLFAQEDEYAALEVEWLRKARAHAAWRADVLG